VERESPGRARPSLLETWRSGAGSRSPVRSAGGSRLLADARRQRSGRGVRWSPPDPEVAQQTAGQVGLDHPRLPPSPRGWRRSPFARRSFEQVSRRPALDRLDHLLLFVEDVKISTSTRGQRSSPRASLRSGHAGEPRSWRMTSGCSFSSSQRGLSGEAVPTPRSRAPPADLELVLQHRRLVLHHTP